eukprot:COSAG01_NODE_8522_length_2755_cov_2.393449_2_plen_72_part_00
MADALAQLRITDPALLCTIRQHRVQVCDFLCQLLSRVVPSNLHSGRSLSVSNMTAATYTYHAMACHVMCRL